MRVLENETFMNLAELERKLMTAARRAPADDRVPYAFEKRILSRLKDRGASDGWVASAETLWRAAISCMAVAVVMVAVTLSVPEMADTEDEVSPEFESILLASADQPDNPLLP